VALMVIDTSAIVAILLDEAEHYDFDRLIQADDVRLVSAVTRVEAAFVIEGRRGHAGRVRLDRFFQLTDVEIVGVTPEQAELAVEAFRRYGKGQHPIGLNIGDCFPYALAKSTGEPLLFKGDDFEQTDIVPVYRPR
jgi:ribonuclease VapC